MAKLKEPMTREDLDALADIIWWIKGYVAGAGHSWESCPFGAEHIEALRKARINLWEFIEEPCQN